MRKASEYGVFSGPYFPVFSPNTEKYEPEKTSHLDTFHAVIGSEKFSVTLLYRVSKAFRIFNGTSNIIEIVKMNFRFSASKLYPFKLNKRSTRKRCKTQSKLTMKTLKTPEFFMFSFEHIHTLF